MSVSFYNVHVNMKKICQRSTYSSLELITSEAKFSLVMVVITLLLGPYSPALAKDNRPMRIAASSALLIIRDDVDKAEEEKISKFNERNTSDPLN